MEENFFAKKFSFFNVCWVKSVVVFFVLLIVFCAGVCFGGHRGDFRGMRGGEGRGNMFNASQQNKGMMQGNCDCQGKRLNQNVVPQQNGVTPAVDQSATPTLPAAQ